jgi:predicted permease
MSWWHRLWRGAELEEQLEKELRFHLEQHTADLIARGSDPVEARRQAVLAIGGPTQVKEGCRDARGTRWLEELWQDLRYALRTLRQKPGFACVALCTLALGAGATTVMFTVVNGVLLKPLPYLEPDRLVKLQERTEQATRFGNLWAFSYPNFLDCLHQSRSLTLAAWRYGGGTLSQPGEAEYVDGNQVSSGLFSVLGVTAPLGRTFLPEDDRPGGAPVAMISYSLWQRRFGASPTAIGASLIFEGKPYLVVGVVPAGFRLSTDEVDLFTPLGQNTDPGMQNREAHRGIQVVGRLQPGGTVAQAQAELTLIGRHLADQYPKSNAGRDFLVEPLRPEVGDVGSTLWLLLGAVSLVLLIACVNIASLLLARAISRDRELAMRVALGAGRGRVARQCLTESAVLALAGGGLGVLLAALGIRPFVALWPGSLPRASEVRLDGRVLLFALAVSLLTGLLFGLAPALRVPTRQLANMLRGGARTIAGSSRRLHGGFVVSEIALAIVLLVSAGILGRTLLRLSSIDSGLDIKDVLTARVALSSTTMESPVRIRAAWQEVLDRAQRAPGVQFAAIVDTVPMREGNNQIGYWTTPAEPPANQQPTALATCVSRDYFQVMRIPLRQGRFFDDRDRPGSEQVAIIDDVMAQQAFGGRDALGKHLWIGLGADPVRVIGVAGHVRHWGPVSDDQAQVRAQVYYPFSQLPQRYLRRWSELMSIAVRAGGAATPAVESLRREVRGATGDLVLYEVRTMDQIAGATLARQRFLLLLFGIFAGLALLLACIGIYGVLAYVTGQRIPEIGVRMALGATAGDCMRLVLRQSIGMIAAGAAIGMAAAFAAGKLLERLVEGVRSTDPMTFALMLMVLIVAALFASYLPARRASRVDPMKALRQE